MIHVLVICDDLWHPGEIVVRGVDALDAPDMDFDVVMDAKDSLHAADLDRYQVIMNCKCNNITAANTAPWFDPGVTEVGPAELENYVRQGGGFLSVHSGNAFYRDNDCPAYIAFVGNYFVQHPPRCDVQVTPEPGHPITRDIQPFTIRDEHYEIKTVAEDITPILYTCSAAGGRQLGGYVREMGRGRLCVLTPGHTFSVWRNGDYQQLLRQAIRWCAGQDGEAESR